MSGLRVTYGDLDLTDEPFLIEFGSDWGAPQYVTEALAMLLQDGEIELSERASNRTFGFNVLIEGTDFADLADSEALLVAECDKERNLLTLDPGDFGQPTVFETFRNSPVYQRSEDMEAARIRRYALTIRALPHGRSDTEVVVEALAIGATTTVVQDGTSTTNWSSTAGAVSTSGGMVQVSTTDDYSTVPLTYTAAVDMTGLPYLYVDWLLSGTSAMSAPFRAYADGLELARMAAILLTGGLTRHYFLCPDTSVAAFRFDASPAAIPTSATFKIDQVVKTDVPPSLGTPRQLLRSVAVAGSARTQGRLSVEHATDALGDTHIFVFPDDGRGYVPALRNTLTSGQTTTADAALVSGARSVLNSIANFDVRASTLYPGSHLIIARLRKNGGTADQTLRITSSTMLGVLVLDSTPGEVETTHNMTSTWKNYTLGRLILPSVDLSDTTNGIVRITLTDTDATDDIDFDEVWIYNTDVGQLIRAKCGTAAPETGGTSNRMFVLPATTDDPRPRVLRGYAADMTDAFYAGASDTTYPMEAWEAPMFKPPSTAVFTVTSNATAAEVELAHFPRFHTHATPVT